MRVHRQICRIAALQTQRIDIPAGRSEVAHDAGDEGDPGSVVRYLRHGKLLAGIGRGVDNPGISPAVGKGVQLCGPPVVVAVAGCGRADEAFAAGAPIVFVDE